MHERNNIPHIAVVGGGFAGFWAAAAARAATAHSPVAVTLVTPNPSLSIRPRLYEADLEPSVVDLRPILEPIGVTMHVAAATSLDSRCRRVHLDDGESIQFDAAVLATGSFTPLSGVSGLAEHAYRVDVHHRAAAFNVALADARRRRSRVRVTVAGGGLTGIELAAELASTPGIAVALVDSGEVGRPFGDAAAAAIRTALSGLGIRLVDGRRVVDVAEFSAILDDGAEIGHDLLVWCAGLRANRIDGLDGFARDELDRLVVDAGLCLDASVAVWAAGDAARFQTDGEHVAPMSCQFAIPSGRVAGFNAAAAIAGRAPVAMEVDRYVTCIDLGSAGAVLTRGWERALALTGAEGKRTKKFINRTAIYPPARPDALLAAARPGAGARWG